MNPVLIKEQLAPASGACDFSVLTLNTFRRVELFASGVTVTTDDTEPRMTFYVAGSEIVTGYRWAVDVGHSGGTSANTGADDAASFIGLCKADATTWGVGNASTEGFDLEMNIWMPGDTALYKMASWRMFHTDPAGLSNRTTGVGVMDNAAAIDGIKLYGDSNLTAGRVKLIGYA